MRILVVGAGAIGGYFGARLLKAGRDVTFLVRAKRAAQLAAIGLIVKSPFGDIDWPAPPTISADRLAKNFDLIILSCKAYDLDGAIESFAPAVGPGALILPLLNGMRHLDALDQSFGAEQVLGGLCSISTTLDAEGRIHHFGNFHNLAYGARSVGQAERVASIGAALSNAGFDERRSDKIALEMWEKWTFIAAAASITCLMRAAAGDIAAAGASDLAIATLDECAGIAADNGYAPREPSIIRGRTMLTAPGSEFVASMLRDVERGAPTEADHIIGDLLQRSKAEPDPFSLLRIAYAHLKAYEARRAREAQKA
ncbi:2-dehydropantoate 2-reductase [Methylocella silvestris BL2]|uniref:2-dehydropantoate 2-reductase n=1 Tax=Methylocella silvestris (strain DSM 15510 / CIP 108128 / LMG 27833 / NCIMB 13906 / BL2) TaxID=395965 RepID=B8EQ33_METSB|nr:2-dehydropantoate 2-reductase [Methylocella silvestris]ACK51523.1 2-dehydropantoate 2-reductase [Methylocella silvestris BL2]